MSIPLPPPAERLKRITVSEVNRKVDDLELRLRYLQMQLDELRELVSK